MAGKQEPGWFSWQALGGGLVFCAVLIVIAYAIGLL